MKWDAAELSDLTSIVTKGTTPTTMGRQFTETGINFVKAEALNGDTNLDSQSFACIDEETHDLLKRSKLEENDVLVTIAGAQVGRCGFVRPEHTPANTNQAVGIVRVDKKKANPRFVYYFFKLPSTFAMCQSLGAAQAAQPNVTLTALRGFRLPTPKRKEQDRIAEVLSSYDELMENNRRRMELLEEAVRLLYREWFVRLRFPGHEHTRFTNGLPQGWESKTLGSITAKIGSGATPRGGAAAYLSEGITLIRSQNVYDDRFDDTGLAFISEEQAADLDGVTVQSQDILLNITGASVARCCMTPDRYLPARVNQHVMIIRMDSSKADPFLVHAAINSDERKRQLLSYAQKGSTREALTKDMISDFAITLPTDTLMRQFNEVAGTCFRQRENLALQNQKLRAARDLLLPRLMSGEIGV